MPSSLVTGPKLRSLFKGRMNFGIDTPDFIVTANVSASQFAGANSGVCVFTVPSGRRVAYLGGTEVHSVAGDNPLRIKKVVAGNTSAPGAADGTGNVSLTASIPTTTTANTPYNFTSDNAQGWDILEAGDRLCIAASLANTGLAGSVFQINLAWVG